MSRVQCAATWRCVSVSLCTGLVASAPNADLKPPSALIDHIHLGKYLYRVWPGLGPSCPGASYADGLKPQSSQYLGDATSSPTSPCCVLLCDAVIAIASRSSLRRFFRRIPIHRPANTYWLMLLKRRIHANRIAPSRRAETPNPLLLLEAFSIFHLFHECALPLSTPRFGFQAS
ncbi:hypothetical protein EDB81DRAFT_781695 [Dactylonectria macrodidyma]|uniref:Secreted protein n=1 Tax=Dactylonectria macrodidyma TaxID=307937 RepID=A0A9P9JKG5_9HYPO|nr:hypothetical protein EDB81DRAFT_781695 [Dactylonectria macrodidyma]